MNAITAIVNLHREGRLCQSTLRSVIAAADRALSQGLACEILVVIDRGDAATSRAILPFADRLRVEACDFGDLSRARNFGVARAKSEFIAIMDGDDLMGSSWLATAAETVARNVDREVVAHPRFNLVFGEGLAPRLMMHPDMDEERVDLTFLKGANLWTALSFARAEIYLRFPYRPNAIESGFGYEDWSWNFETTNAGIVHVAPPGTIHFIRRKVAGSLLTLSSQNHIIPNLPIPGAPLPLAREALG
jgi:glycosyltransferase involved in cell wall biosynthesis